MASPALASAAPEIEAPGLNPPFERGAHDYTVPCADPVPITARADADGRTRIGAGEWAAGTARRSVALEPGQAVRVEIRGGGEPAESYFLRCLPDDFPEYEFEAPGEPSRGLYMVSPMTLEGPNPNYTFVFDGRGVPVWWERTDPPTIDAKLMRDGSIAWTRWSGEGYGTEPGVSYEIRTLEGKLVRTIATVGADTPTDHHELIETASDNYILLSYRPREHVDLRPYINAPDATVLDSVIQEVTPEGELVWEWSSADHIALAETGRWLAKIEEPYDLTHINAVSETTDGDLLISLRHTDAIYRIDRATGRVEWKLGGTPIPQSLRVVNDLFPASLGAQHDVRWAGEDEVTVFDNQTETGYQPRALRFRILDDTAMLVDSASDFSLQSSICCGSARQHTDGSWLISWGGTNLVSEVDAAGHRTFALRFAEGSTSYRAVPADAHPVERYRGAMSARIPDAR